MLQICLVYLELTLEKNYILWVGEAEFPVAEHHWIYRPPVLIVVIIQLLSHVQPFATLWTAACQASLSSSISLSLLRFMSIDIPFTLSSYKELEIKPEDILDQHCSEKKSYEWDKLGSDLYNPHWYA